MKLKKIIKRKLIDSGLKPFHQFDVLLGLLKLGEWLKENENNPKNHFDSRHDLYSYINSEVINNVPIDYLEFGVYKGASIEAWTKLSTNRKSRFFGFDSFSGLPEEWKTFFVTFNAGTFDTGGKIPELGDQRVSFIKGYFQDTLPNFLNEFSIKNQLIVHLDADLYSSTLFVLTKMDSYLVPGTIIIFDEFSSVNTEFKAFMDYTLSYRKEYKLIGTANYTYNQVAVRIVE
jgi:hypothetical protein